MSARPRARARGMWLTVAPLYVFTLALVASPLLYVLYLSFIKKDVSWGYIYEFTLNNYARMLDPMYIGVFANSVKLALSTTVITLLVGYPFAGAMAAQSPRARSLVMLLVIIPFWTNALIRTYGWMTLLSTRGPLNELLLTLGLIGQPIRFLNNYGAVLFGMVYSLLPFMILPCFSSIEKLDRSVLEASRDLGANRVVSFFTVMLPLTLPGVLSGCVLVFIPSIGLFFISDLMGGAKTMYLGNLIHNQLTVARDWPFGAALSVVMSGMTLVLMLLYRRLSGTGQLEGL